MNYKEKSASTVFEQRPENRIEYHPIAEMSRLAFDSMHESPQATTYYESTKQEEMQRESVMRKDLVLQDLVPLLLSQNGEFPATKKLLVAYSRFGATQVNPDCAKMKDIDRLVPFARKFHDEPYRVLLEELIRRASADDIKLN